LVTTTLIVFQEDFIIMPATSFYVVLGATGNIGSAAVKVISEKAAVHAVVRDPSSDKAKKLTENNKNVTLVKGDYKDNDSLRNALKGAAGVYIIATSSQDRGTLSANAVKIAGEVGVPRIVVLSVPTVAAPNSVFGKQFVEVEETAKKLDTSKSSYVILRLPLFIENNFGNVQSIKNDSKIYSPIPVNQAYTSVSVHDAALAAAAVLLDNKFNNETFVIHSKPFSQAELAAAFSKALGREISAVQISNDATKQAYLGAGWPEWQVDGVIELFDLIAQQHPSLTKPSNDFQKLTNQEPTTIQQWTAQVAGAFQ
jgi:uncharacterized protein YbjT (DUF2867 family)